MRRHSQKRDAILEKLRSVTCHPSAEWVYLQMKNEYPDISLATVYRNLSEFTQDGSVAVVCTVNGQARYDGCVKPHAHFICEECGEVDDVPGAISDAVIAEAGRSIGALISGYDLTFKGKCSKCAASIPHKNQKN